MTTDNGGTGKKEDRKIYGFRLNSEEEEDMIKLAWRIAKKSPSIP